MTFFLIALTSIISMKATLNDANESNLSARLLKPMMSSVENRSATECAWCESGMRSRARRICSFSGLPDLSINLGHTVSMISKMVLISAALAVGAIMSSSRDFW